MKKLLLGICLVLLLAQCKKDHLTDTAQAAALTVPAFTETGANTFGTYIDGKAWANFGYQWLSGAYSTQPAHNQPNTVSAGEGVDTKGDSIYSVDGRLTVTQSGKVIRDETMYLQFAQNNHQKGVRQLTQVDFMLGYRIANGQSYYSLMRSPVTVTVYQDTLIAGKRILSGKFEGTLYGYTNLGAPLNNSVTLTGGTFDVVIN